jgi:hypothetical protein
MDESSKVEWCVNWDVVECHKNVHVCTFVVIVLLGELFGGEFDGVYANDNKNTMTLVNHQ